MLNTFGAIFPLGIAVMVCGSGCRLPQWPWLAVGVHLRSVVSKVYRYGQQCLYKAGRNNPSSQAQGVLFVDPAARANQYR